jgi:hypothetical protein
MAKQTKMTEKQINAHIDAELRQCIGFSQSGDYIAAARQKALSYYHNRPRPDDRQGRSRLQSSDVQDVIEGFLPSLLAPFISSDAVVEFKPTGEEDVGLAEQATALVNHCIMVDNDGLQILYTWAKDALLQKNGFVFVEWNEKTCTRRVQQRVDYMGLQKIQVDKSNEVVQYAAFDGYGNPIPADRVEAGEFDEMTMFDVDFRVKSKKAYPRIGNIAPENFVISSTASSLKDARILGWRERVTISTLRQEGHDEELIERVGAAESNTPLDQTGEATERWRDQGADTWNSHTESGADRSTRTVWRSVYWTYADYDGDGVAELRKIIRAGAGEFTGGVVLYNEEVDFCPVLTFTAIPNPHQVFGRSFADLTFDVQDAKTSLIRMTMDATYHTVYPRHVLDVNKMGDDTWDDLQDTSPNAIIRVEEMGAVQPYRDVVDIGAAYQMIEYYDRVREVRTPVTRQMQGVDPDVLNDRTAREATIQANASQMRLELIMRLFAEAVAELCKFVAKTLIKHQDKARTMRMTNKWVQIDPRYWDADMDVTPRVGLGTGTKEQQTQALMLINNLQMTDLQAGLPTVDPEKLYATRARIVENAGLSSPETYFNDPANAKNQEAQQQPDPAQMEAAKQEEAAKVQEAIQNALKEGEQRGMDQAKMQIEQMKLQMQAQIEAAKLQASRQTEMEQMASKERMHEKEIQMEAFTNGG